MPTSDDRTANATALMMAAATGDATAAERLLPLVYQRLRSAAGAQMAGERFDRGCSSIPLIHASNAARWTLAD